MRIDNPVGSEAQLTGSFSGSFLGDGSGLFDIVSASYSTTASYVDFANLGGLPSGLISSSAQLSNTTIPGNLTIGGTLTAEQFYTEYVTSSVIYQSGSTKFGDTANDTHQFTGSVRVLGSITGSLLGTAASASYVAFSNIGDKPTLLSGSAQIADEISGSFNSVSSSIALDINNISSSIATLSGSHLEVSSSLSAFKGTYNTGSFTGSFFGNGAGVVGVVSSSYSLTASYVNLLGVDGFAAVSTSIENRLTDLETFSSSLNSTFATDAELSAATASLSASLAVLSSSFEAFSSSYNSGSFTGSFVGDGSGLIGVLASSAQNTVITVKNLSGATIAKGTPLYLTNSGTSGNLAGAYPADAGNPSRMPAGAIAGESLAAGAEGIGLINGFIQGVNTTGFTSGAEVFVAVGGGYTQTAPTGSVLVQKLGNIEKVGANGSGVINGPGTFRAVPNIQPGKVFVGGNNHVPITVSTGSFYTGSYTGSFKGDGSQVLGVVSSSYSETSSYSLGVDYANIIGTPEGLISGSAQLANTTIPGNLTIDGTLTAQQFYTQYVTSSVIYKSGSTKFGDTADDVHEFTGSIKVFGSVSGSFSGSFQGNGSLLTNLNVPAGVYKYTGSANNSILPISGGNITSATSDYSVIAGGFENTMASDYSVIGGGLYNQATGDSAGILGGSGNIASGANSVIAGGVSNTASGNNSFIGGGGYGTASGYGSVVVGGGSAIAGPGLDDGLNNATGFHSIVGGGNSNKAAATYSSVLGGHVNIASGSYSTVAGGTLNKAIGPHSTIGGGQGNCSTFGSPLGGDKGWTTVGGGCGNTASNVASTISGGKDNTASAYAATVSGGYGNLASGACSVVIGGRCNCATGTYSTVSGYYNSATGCGTVVGGGKFNSASGALPGGGFGMSTISGGASNTASGAYSSIGGGTTNTASGCQSTIGGGSGNTASTFWASIVGGNGNTSSGTYSIAGGYASTASAYASVAFGRCNTASGAGSVVAGGGGFNAGNTASGACSGILGGKLNHTCGFANSFIVGSNICATAACYTFMNNTCTLGTTRTQTLIETSAKKHKQNINPLGSQLQNVTALNPVEFTWKESNKKDIGLIAEEVDKIYPELVSREENGDIHGINYSKITAVLIKAVQEQQKQIEELKLEVQKLKGL